MRVGHMRTFSALGQSLAQLHPETRRTRALLQRPVGPRARVGLTIYRALSKVCGNFVEVFDGISVGQTSTLPLC